MGYGVTITHDEKHHLKPFMARVTDWNGKRKLIGYYSTEDEADRAYDSYVLHHHLDSPFNWNPLTKERLFERKVKLTGKKFWTAIQDYISFRK
jgi:hypothetical protein